MWGFAPRTPLEPSAGHNAIFHTSGYNPGSYEPCRPQHDARKARQAIEILETQLLGTGTIEPLVALYFEDHIEQVEFQDPSVLEHFDLRTAQSFDYLRTLVRIKNPQAALITLDVRMGPFESDERDVLADATAIFPMLDSPLLTIQVLLPYTRCGGRIAVSNVHYTEMPGEEGGAPCQLFKIFSGVAAAVC